VEVLLILHCTLLGKNKFQNKNSDKKLFVLLGVQMDKQLLLEQLEELFHSEVET
jgi:hypothetical protein